MTVAAFLGFPGALAKAYPKSLREKIAESFTLPLPELSQETWASADLSEVEVIFSTWGMAKLDEAFLAAAPKLRAVFYAAGTVKSFATPESYARNVAICSAWRANAIPVAEYTLATIILSLKKFWMAFRTDYPAIARITHWDAQGAYACKIGLLSLGAIGLQVAKLLKSLEVEVLACDPFCRPEVAAEAGVTLVPLETLFRECEVVSIHTPLLPETTKMVTPALVRTMRPGATLINTSRGAILDEDPVMEVLRDRSDLTAILDVAIAEPPAAKSLVHHLPNVIYTPHVAGSMGGEISRMGAWMLEEALRLQHGEPLQHKVTIEMLDKVA